MPPVTGGNLPAPSLYTPPPALSEADLNKLFKNSDPNKVLEASSASYELIQKLKDLNTQIKQQEEDVDEIKQKIMGQMQDAEVLTYQGQKLVSWKTPKPSFRLDSKELSKSYPELAKQFQIPIQNSRRFVLKELS